MRDIIWVIIGASILLMNLGVACQSSKVPVQTEQTTRSQNQDDPYGGSGGLVDLNSRPEHKAPSINIDFGGEKDQDKSSGKKKGNGGIFGIFGAVGSVAGFLFSPWGIGLLILIALFGGFPILLLIGRGIFGIIAAVFRGIGILLERR